MALDDQGRLSLGFLQKADMGPLVRPERDRPGTQLSLEAGEPWIIDIYGDAGVRSGCGYQLGLSLEDPFEAAEKFDVRRSDVGQNADGRLDDPGQFINIAPTGCAHFEHSIAMGSVQLQNRKRQ